MTITAGIQTGDTFLLEVASDGLTGTVFVAVEDMHTLSRDTRRTTQSFPVFNRVTPHRFISKEDDTFSVTGYLNIGDAGQAILLAAASSGDDVIIRTTFDGTPNGYKQRVMVTGHKFDVSAEEESIQGLSFDFIGTAEPVIYGTGAPFL